MCPAQFKWRPAWRSDGLLIAFSRFRCSDPFFPLSFLVNSWFPGTLDAFFQALFLCALLLFWLCVYHGIRVQVGPVLYLYSVSFVAHYESYFVCFYVVSTGREEMPDVLPAQADHCRSSVALGGYAGHMANVSLTSLATSSLIQTVTYNGAFSEFAGLMNSKTLPISIKWT